MIGKNINNAKTALMTEIKTVCEAIQKTQTFSGLISLESRINEMHEKLVILKYLEQQSILETSKIKLDKTNTPTKNYNFPKLALSLNDNIAFQNQLFNKDKKLFENVVMQLNKSASLEEAKKILEPLATKLNWNSKKEFAQRFEKLIEKRFLQ